ncbi:hypothetical protein [uncultured Mucilaginibacter sp.]|uniref:hypothetical protein n=1 Tax=uncultured Mucilaginibacter sp. TaxID=797541 RepID=UPI0025D3C0E3|nr:hypothetical protein [uncultured Mucilaginibacter sp.]
MKKIIMNVAVYEYAQTGAMSCVAGLQFVSSTVRQNNDAIRISEWQKVEFEAIPMEAIIPSSVENIDDQIARIKEEAIEKCSKLQGQKDELLAITEGMSNAN